MSNNIYDILGKLDGLAPKAAPDTTTEPVYESVDPRGDIMSAVTQLEERFMGFKEAKTKKRKEPSVEVPADDLTRSADPDVVRLATKARFNKPQAKNDFEAIVSYVNKQEKELERAEQADILDREKIEKTQAMLAKTQANQDALRKVIDNTDQRFRALNAKVASGQITQQDQKAAQAAQQIEKDADTAKAAVAKDVTAPEQPTTAPEVPQDTNIYDFPDAEKPASTQTTTATATDQPPAEELPAGVASMAKARTRRTSQPRTRTTGDPLMTQQPVARARKQAENKESKLKMLREYREGDPDLGLINYNEALKAFQNAQEKITLDFGNGKLLTLYDYQLYGLLSELTGDQNQERKVARIENVMSNYDSIVQLLLTPKVKKWIQAFPEYAKKNPKFKARMRDVDRGQFKLEPSPPEDPRYNPETDTMLPHPYQRSDSQLEENLGNSKMTKPTSIIEAVRSVEYKKLKEGAKPDFLDLDKDGDTDEPMKSAAKSAKDDEPAKPDSDAVAKRKRLQALKDKQEDERAEKDDYDSKSSSRFVKGRAYGGSAQKDDDADDEVDEAMFPGSGIGKSLRGTDQGLRQGADAVKAGAVATPFAGAGAAVGAAAQASMATGAATLFAPIAGAGFLAGAGLVAGTALTYKALQWLARKLFGTTEEAMEFAKAHLAAAQAGQPQFQFQGKNYPVKVKPNQIRDLKDEITNLEIRADQKQGTYEAAPPGAKAERMVKGIKKSLSKDGHLSGKDKAIAYATTWKAHNKGQVEEATNFGDTIKNSKAKMTKVTVKEGKEAIRNHPIYTTKEAWDHYAQELAEQEAMECGSPMNSFVSEEPVVNVQQELDEIAKLAGLPVKTCESCGCAESACKCNENLAPMAPSDSASPLTHTELEEAATRKDFRMVADLIKSNPDREKAKELAHHHADIFKQQNPRFKREMFLAACGLEESTLGAVAGGVAGAALGKTPAAASMGAQIGDQLTSEGEVEEGNEFSGALAKAKASGAKEFEVDGKKYTVKEDINVNISANGEEDAVKLIQKLAGMPVIAVQAQPVAEEYCDACDSTECHCETVAEDGPKERDVEYTNTPREEVAGTDAAIPDGGDLNRAKRQFKKEYPGDNPMAVAEAKEESLWQAYESLINDVKA